VWEKNSILGGKAFFELGIVVLLLISRIYRNNYIGNYVLIPVNNE
jgi:hypothetical protein